jgi:pimeloyl-ACP methyl ester carboxylesterase
MSTFVLVHGAYHGSWCWDPLLPELARLGHTAVTPELPITDPQAGWDDYRDAVLGCLDGVSDPILVGHSLAGLVVPLVADRRPVPLIVYLCALIPEAGWTVETSHQSAAADEDDGGMTVDEQGRLSSTRSFAERHFYNDCSAGQADWAFARLRPQAPIWTRPWPLERLPSVPNAYVVCAEDQMVDPDWSRRTAPQRLGCVPAEMPGGHSPFLSRPAALAELLVRTVH